MKKLLSLAFIAALIGFQGCSTDFDVIGDYKELSIVYGLLDFNNNPNNGGDGHLIRVQKSFLGEMDAAVMAANPDSSYFNVFDLEVKLIEFDDDLALTGREILLTDTMVEGKDTVGGFGFFGPEQRLYYTNEDLNAENAYDLRIHNTRTGYLDSLKFDDDGRRNPIRLLNSNAFTYSNPNPSIPKLLFYDPVSGYKNQTIRFNMPAHIKMGEVWLRFHYREVINNEADTLHKSIDILMTGIEIEDNEVDFPHSGFNFSFSGETFYQTIGNSLEPIDGHRLIGTEYNPVNGANDAAQIFTYIGGQNLHNYITLNAPSTSGALTDNPSHSNMKEGLGLFSSRSQIFHPKYLYFNSFSATQLAGGQYTGDLGFIE